MTTGAAQAAPPQESGSNASAKTTPAAAATEHGGLPFSGLDVALLAAGAGPLLLFGMTLRRKRSHAAVKPAQEETLTLA
ncbi:MAG: hypothetical protein ACJ75P_05530 [Gaiellaceae bacterium]